MGNGTFVISGTDGSTTQTSTPNTVTVSDGVTMSSHFYETAGAGSDLSTYTTTARTFLAHDTIVFSIFLCNNGSCNSFCNDPTSGFTVTDSAGDLFTAIPAAFVNSPGWCGYAWYAKNVAGGSGTITITANTAHMWYMNDAIATFSAANPIAPIDTSVSNTAHGTGASISLISAGNVATRGEVIYASMGTASTVTLSGAFTSVAGAADPNMANATAVNPTIGAGVTLSGAQTSGFYSLSMIGVKP